MIFQKKNKIITVSFLCALLILTIASCSNKKAAQNDANTNIVEVKEQGIQFIIKQSILDKGLSVEPNNSDINNHPSVSLYFNYTPITDKLFSDFKALPTEQLTQEKYDEFYKQLDTHSKLLMNIALVKPDEYQNAVEKKQSLEDLTGLKNTEKLDEKNGYIYLISTPDNNLDGMSDEEKALYHECSASLSDIRKNITFIPIKSDESNSNSLVKVPDFTAEDLEGNPITQDIFSKKKITMVNVWGTFCTPCVDEMPGLGEMARSMPENVQMVGYIIDINDDQTRETAKNILKKSNADFTQIVANASMSNFTNSFIGVPATFFVDQQGNILGDPILSGSIEDYQKALKEYLK